MTIETLSGQGGQISTGSLGCVVALDVQRRSMAIQYQHNDMRYLHDQVRNLQQSKGKPAELLTPYPTLPIRPHIRVGGSAPFYLYPNESGQEPV